MRTRLEIVSKLVEDKHITFEEGMMLMEPVKHPLSFPGFRGTTEPNFIPNVLRPEQHVILCESRESLNKNYCSK